MTVSVRFQVEPKLVFEVAFDLVHRSSRHKSGVAMRFRASTASAGTSPPPRPTGLQTFQAMIVG